MENTRYSAVMSVFRFALVVQVAIIPPAVALLLGGSARIVLVGAILVFYGVMLAFNPKGINDALAELSSWLWKLSVWNSREQAIRVNRIVWPVGFIGMGLLWFVLGLTER